MPELPEVQTVLTGVADELKDVLIKGLECFYPGTVVRDPELPPQPFPAKLSSHERRGKYMMLHLDNETSLIVHLRMTGKLVSDKASGGDSKHERACILFGKGRKLHFIDIRTFGKIIHCRTENLNKYLPKLGIEPLSEGFDELHLRELLAKRSTPIKNALLDQALIAGLGNIYACEILYRAKIHPETPAKSLDQKKLREIVRHTKEVLTQAIAMNGTSISDFRRVDDKTGQFQNFLQVYQKETCPKGHPIKRIVMGGRGTFFCPVCQKQSSNPVTR